MTAATAEPIPNPPPTTTTPTPKRPWGRPFVPGNPFASAGGFASNAAKRAAKAAALAAAANPPPIVPPSAVPAAVLQQLEIVQEQIKRTRSILNDTKADYCEHCERAGMQPHHRAQLLRSLDTLLDRQRVLLNIPMPGSLKPSSRRESRRSTDYSESAAPSVEPPSPPPVA